MEEEPKCQALQDEAGTFGLSGGSEVQWMKEASLFEALFPY